MSSSPNRIKLTTFKDNLRHAEGYVARNPKEAKYLKDFLFRINRYVKKLKASNSDLTEEELKMIFDEDLSDICSAAFQSAKISRYYMRYACFDIFSKHPEQLDSLLSYMSSHDLSYDDISPITRSTLQLSKLYYASLLKKEFDSQTRYTDIHEFTTAKREEIAPKVNEVLATSIDSIVHLLDKYSFLSNYLEMNSKKLTSLGFPDFASCLIPTGENATGRYDSSILLKILSKENLMTYHTPEDLLTLFSFWTNRFNKELDSYLQAMFVIQDFNLYSDLLSGSFKSPPVDVLQRSLVKMNVFYDPVRFYLEMKKGEKLSENGEVEFDTDCLSYDFDSKPFVSYMLNEYGTDYEEHFNQILPESENNLAHDATAYFDLYNPIFATYSLKDSSIVYLLMSLTEAGKYKNAGIIRSTLRDRFIGIGIDNGMTDTFLVHINRDVLSDFVTKYLGNEQYKFPLYYGDYDFTRRTYSTPIMAPLSAEQLALLETPSRYYNSRFVKHMQNVARFNDITVPKDYVTIDGHNYSYSAYKGLESDTPEELNK